MRLNLCYITAALSVASCSAAFLAHRNTFEKRSLLVLNLDKNIADMVDKQYYAVTHPDFIKSKEELYRKRNAAYLSEEKVVPTEFEGVDMIRTDAKDYAQYRKDKFLASKDPQRYCVERCISTGSCEVYEDIFTFTPEEVTRFCTDCVLSEEEEPCDIPPEAMDSFFESTMSP